MDNGIASSENHSITPLKCDIYENLIIDNSALAYISAFSDGEALPHVHIFRGESRHTKQLPLPQKFVYSEEEVIFAGGLDFHYGHFLTESLSRLWYAKEHDLPLVWFGDWHRHFKGYKVIRGYIFKALGIEYKSRNSLEKWQLEAMELLGIENKHIFMHKPTCFKKVHIPQTGLIIDNYLHPEHVKFLASTKEYEMEKGKYVYFSRNHVGKNNKAFAKKTAVCLNETEIEETLKARGWEIVYPEDLSISEQINYMQIAEVCCFIEGSAQHTLLLTHNTKTRFIALPRMGASMTYRAIACQKAEEYYTLNLEFEYVYPEGGTQTDNKKNLKYDLESFEKYLEKTDDFTKNLEAYPDIFKKPEKLEDKHLNLPPFYYEPIR